MTNLEKIQYDILHCKFDFISMVALIFLILTLLFFELYILNKNRQQIIWYILGCSISIFIMLIEKIFLGIRYFSSIGYIILIYIQIIFFILEFYYFLLIIYKIIRKEIHD